MNRPDPETILRPGDHTSETYGFATSARVIPHGAPSDYGVRADGVHRFLDALETDPCQDPHSLIIVRHGHVVAEGWWAPYTRDVPQLVYSLSKSFTSTALGFAVTEGIVDVDAPVLDYFPEFAQAVTDDGTRAMRVRDLAAMATGHTFDTLEAVLSAGGDPVRAFLSIPPSWPPGSVFAYNQFATYTLAAIIQRSAGMRLSAYLTPRLFRPLGLPRFAWEELPPGREIGFSGLYTTTDALARLGLLYLDRGAWNGRQLLSPDWVADATRAQIASTSTGGEDAPDWFCGYGYQFWMARHGYRGDGAYGQLMLVLPQQDAVIAYTGATLDLQTTLNHVWTYLLPALSTEPAGQETADDDTSLADRLARLAVRGVAERTGPLRGIVDDETYWNDAVLTPSPALHCALPRPETVRVRRDAGGTWHVALTDSSGSVGGPIDTTRWSVSGIAERVATWGVGPVAGSAADAASVTDVAPVAMQGGWDAAGDLHCDIIFLHTVHRLRLTCFRATRQFTASWETTPLVFQKPVGLAALRAPAVGPDAP